ncbi:MAG: Ig-like domain-containing protein, partial [Sneathiellales bacterium]|nr:Ig-like domain-containing protein [Sneathiellales bacterium]
DLQQYPSVAGLTTGGYVVVWHGLGITGDSFARGVAMQLYDAAGQKVGSETLVNTYTTSNQYYADVVGLSNGDYVVAWSNTHPSKTIYGQRFSSSGVALGSEFLMHSNSSGYGGAPLLTALSDGGFIMTARANQYDTDSHGIVAQRFASDGTLVGTEYQVNTNETGVQDEVSVAQLSNGNLIYAWQSDDIDGAGDGVSAQIFDIDGTKVGVEFQVNSFTTNNQYDPAVTALKGGGFVVSWNSKSQVSSNAYSVHTQMYDNDGNAVGGEYQVGGTGKLYPEITSLVDGGYVVVWSGYGSNGYDVWAQQFDAQGTEVGSEVLINQYVTSQQTHPEVTALQGGGYVVTWMSDGQDGSGDGIYSRVMDGTSGTDFTGSNGNDVLIGSDADEVLTGQGGNDVIDGNAGQDTARYSGNYADYSVTYDAANDEWTVTHLAGGSDGTDILKNIERLEFADQTIVSDFTTAPTVDQGIADYVGLGNEDISITIPGTAFSDADIEDSFTYSAELVGGGEIPDWLILSNGTFSGTPNNYETGTYNIVVTATDRAGNTVTDTFSITVNHNPDSPIVADGSIITGRDDAVTGVLNGSDDQSATSLLTFSLENSASHGTVTINADGSYTYTPTSGYAGEDSFQYKVTDPDGNTTIATMNVSIYPGTIGDDPEEIVSVTTSSIQYQTDSAGLTGGGYVVTYTTYGADGTGNSYKVAAQVFDADGNAVGSEVTVNTHFSGTQNEPSVTGLSNGGFVVTYDSSGIDGSSGIGAQIFDSTGAKVGSEIIVNSYTDNTQQESSVATLENGGFVVVWETYQTGGSYQEVAMQRFDSAGNKVGSEIQVNTVTLNRQQAPDVTELTNGNIIVTWTSPDVSGNGISGQIFDSDGNAIGSEFVLNTNQNFTQAYSATAALAGGGFIATWIDNVADGSNYAVVGQIFDNTGTKVGSDFVVNSYTSGPQHEISVTGLNDGGFVVTWTSGNGQDGDLDGVFGQQYDAGGVKVGGEFQINTHTASYQNAPSVAALAGGGFVVSWSSRDQDGASGYRVYKRVYDGSANISFDGTDGNDVMIGTDEDEILTGGLGADTLKGGDGADTYAFSRGDGADVIDDTSSDGSSDTLELSGTINHDQLWFEQSGNDLLISVIGTADQVTIDNWYASADNKVESIEASDGMTIDITGVETLVTAMATFSPPGAGATDLSDPAYNDLQDDLAATWS